MRTILLAALVMLGACARPAATSQAGQSSPPQLAPAQLPQSDGAGNRMEALTQQGSRWCSADGAWCLDLTDESEPRVVSGAVARRLPAEGDSAVAAWPFIIRARDAAPAGSGDVYVGLTQSAEQGYSGGGGTAVSVTIYKIATSSSGLRETAIATLPLSSSITIRACFSPADEQRRAGACVDQYRFVSRVRLDEAVTSGPPNIVLETAAASYPGRVTRGSDSTTRPPLTRADLVWASDAICSFRRTYSPTAAGPYAPNIELPACTDYLEP